ncbi:TIGR02117 family protein [Zavarzinia compransoris]|uniref:TIGR02117 family protein n=1 Tax=Zavarzinia marina TaxID=2911065 RepID=UPI001F3169E0|nr:TIGR02117 family protein [Zavarzinia marina]MCF4167438.1 TIGR02117 family protein [Zavarzinia marina]
MRRVLRLLALALGLPVAAALHYAVAALVGAMAFTVPEPPDGQTVTVYVHSNGVHVDIVVPMQALGVDWRRDLGPEAFPFADPAAAHYVGIGWGDRDFYLNTPTWAEMTVGRALGALFASRGSLVHVTLWRGTPGIGAYTRPVVLGQAQYERLVTALRAGFARDAAGRPRPIEGYRYSTVDAFYEGVGTYSAFLTCNEWAAARLREAGVAVGVWSPFPFGIMWNL